MGVQVERETVATPPMGIGLKRLLRPLLGVSLLGKLLGANALIVLIAAVVIRFTSPPQSPEQLIVLSSAFAVAVAVNLLLVWLALRPVHELEDVATKLWQIVVGPGDRADAPADSHSSSPLSLESYAWRAA